MKTYTVHQTSTNVQNGEKSHQVTFVIYANEEKNAFKEVFSVVTNDQEYFQSFEVGEQYALVKQG